MERQMSALESAIQSAQQSTLQVPVINSSICSLLPPANPIITKSVLPDEKTAFRIDHLVPPEQYPMSRHALAKPHSSHSEQHSPPITAEQDKKKQEKWNPYMKVMTLANGYELDTLIFKRYNNDAYNRRGKRQFFSSLFVGIEGSRAMRLPEYKGMLRDNDLIFDSSFESANLMAVFKVEDRVYDLVLQNDINTHGFTQWYNFKVTNKRNNFIARFNIVNLVPFAPIQYKSKSLYNLGMKPIVRSQKSDKNVKKTWRRKGYNIYYDKNELSYEDNDKKCYKTLTFQYDFTIDNDTVQFAHGMPYDLTDLHFILNHIKSNPKVKISIIGNTLMGRPIPLIKISAAGQANNQMQKKAIVILGRQHPGETPGSYIAQEMIMQLLRNTNQVDFLNWRFDIFIFPMVNQDGVTLGNYRSNFAGFDLNRCWLRPDPVKQPEVFAIKNHIKKIQKKYKIELILDLHGHSRKMGSFFYGNNYGTNFMLFPFIASKANRNILFEKSRFSHESETDPKGSTARVVLGNLLRESGGYVYTYEVSFFGNYKQDHTTFAFQQEHYKQLGRTLVQSIYKTYLQQYKQEKTLKQSHFLKTAKTELCQLTINRHVDDEEASGSDSEAEEEIKQEREEIQQFFEQIKNSQQFSPPDIEIIKKPSLYEGVDRQISISSRVRELKELGEPVQKYTQQVKHKIQQLLQKNLNDDLREVILQRLPSIRRQSQRQSTLNQLKKQIATGQIKIIEGYDLGSDAVSGDFSKGKKRLPSPFRVKKYKNYVDWLKVSGETFALQQRQRQRQMGQRHDRSIQKTDNNVHQIKQNMLLINNISKSTDSKSKGSKQLTTINILDNLHEEDKEKEERQKMKPLTKPINKPVLSKEFPSSVAFDDAVAGPMRVNRVDYQREQNRTRRFNATPSKEKKQTRAKLPPI